MSKSNKGRKFFATTATAALVASAIVPVASAAQINDFNTVSPYAQEAVQDLVDRGVIQGDEKGNFNPRKSVTRAEAATILVNVFELESTGTINFTDVKAGAWYYDAINAAVNNGIFQGQGAGKFNPSGNLTRSEAAIILVDSFGLEGTANLSQFTDSASVKAWAQEALEIAVANGVIKGDNGKLNPNAPITRQDFAVMYNRTEAAAVDPATVLVEALEDLKTTAEALVKEVKADNVAAAKTAVADAKAAITAAEEALKAAKEAEVVTEEEVKLAEEAIAAAKTALEAAEKAVAAYEESLLVLKVESVSATNLKEVDVVFNRAVDVASASDKEKYTLASGSVDSAEVLADGKTVRLTVVGELANQVANKLTVNGVKAGDKVVSKTELAFTPLDNTLPTVTEVKNLGTKALKVVFSEPIEKSTALNYKLDGKSFYGSTTQGSREVILTPYDASALSVGEHTLTVAGVEDYFGLKSLSSEHKFTVVEDKVAPTVSKVEATLERVVITFSEEVDPSTVLASNVYWKSGDTKMTAVGKKQLAADKFEFDFTGKALPGYETTLFVEGVKDYSANTITETQVKVQATVDQTRPEVTEVKVDPANNKFITVKFNKPVSAADKKFFTLTDSNGKAVTIKQVIKASGDTTNKIFTIETYNALAGSNTLKVSGVRDLTTLQNTMLDYSTTISVGDTKAPEFAGISASNAKRQIIIAFNEKMDLSTIANPTNYLITVNGNVRTLPEGTEVTPVQDGKAVLITLPAKYGTTDITFPTTLGGAGSVTKIQVMGVKDVAGNILKDYSKQVDVVADNVSLQVYDTAINAAANAVLTEKGTVKVRFSQPIGTASASDFTVTGSSNVSISSVETNGTEYVTIKLAGSDLTTTTNFGITVNATNGIETVTGNKTAGTALATTIFDQVKPVVQLATGVTTLSATGGVITLPFSEKINGGTAADYKYDLVVTDIATGKVVPFTQITTSLTNANGGTDNAIAIAISGGLGEYTVSVIDNAIHIKDTALNTAALSSTYSTAIGAVDAVAPTVSSAVATAGVYKAGSTVDVVVTFSEAVKLNDTVSGTPATLSLGGTAGTISGNKATFSYTVLNTDTVLPAALTAGTISVTGGTITDNAGNLYTPAALSVTTTGVTVDGVAPTVSTSLSTAGTFTATGTQTLVFSEELSTASKAAVKAAVDAAYTPTGTATVSSAWGTGATANTLTVTLGGVMDATNTVVSTAITPIAVTDLAGNTSAALALQ